MSVETDLRIQIRQNDNYLYIVEADDLIAAWCYSKSNRFKRSYDFQRVPTEYRCSAPASETAPLLPCHLSLKTVGVAGPGIKCTGTTACHHSLVPGVSPVVSIDKLKAVDFAKRNVAPYISPILDTATLAVVTKDLGITGTAVPKVIRGRQYIVFGGYAGQRTMFRGTVYSHKNAKIIQMAIGSLGIRNMVRTGARLTIYLTVPLTILQCVLEDQATMSMLLGRLATDVIKVGIASIIGALVGVAVGTAVAYAAVPIFFTIVACAFTGYAIEEIDEQFRLTDKLVETIDRYIMEFSRTKEEIEKECGRTLIDVEREIIFRGTGFDINYPFKPLHRFK